MPQTRQQKKIALEMQKAKSTQGLKVNDIVKFTKDSRFPNVTGKLTKIFHDGTIRVKDPKGGAIFVANIDEIRKRKS